MAAKIFYRSITARFAASCSVMQHCVATLTWNARRAWQSPRTALQDPPSAASRSMSIEAYLPDWRLVQEEGMLEGCDRSHAGPSLGLDPREPGAAGMVPFGLPVGLPGR